MKASMLLLSCLLPLSAAGQELPYPVAMSFQRAAETAGKVDGVVCHLKMEHARSDDTRPFKIVLESPKGRVPLVVSSDGSFKLPALPEEDWARSKLVHNLEKGALSVTFGFDVSGRVGSGESHPKTLFATCSGIADKLGELESVWNVMGRVEPRFNDLQLAIVGLTIPRVEPAKGRALLRKGSVLVRTVELSETGPVALMFDKYDPKEHSLIWDVEKGASPPPAEFIFQTGAAAEQSENAIFIRKPTSNPRGTGR
ncbi:MAG: hypothetical protein AB9869_08500 [Verrucomicrobiia bacterium]